MPEKPTITIQRHSRLLPILVAVLFITMLAYPHPSWLVLLVGLSGVWLTGNLWIKELAAGLHLNRSIRFGWAQVGDRLEEKFSLTNHSWVPGLWIEITDHTTMPDYQASQVSWVGRQSNYYWKTKGICTRRGVFSLGPTTLRTSDPFNLYTLTIHYPQQLSLTVTPPVVPLPTIDIAPGGRAGEGRPHPQALERTVSATTVRPYHPGDTLHTIHWPTSARRNDLYVHQLENTPAGDWWIILDLDETTHVGQGANSTEEQGVILAASLADRGLRTGRAVGLLAYGHSLTRLSPQPGDQQRLQILQTLAQVTTGPHSLSELLGQPSFGRLASLIVITAASDPVWVERLLPRLKHTAKATVLLLDPTAFGGSHDLQGISALLSDLNITSHHLSAALLDRPELQPGRQGRWEWRVSPLGRAIAAQGPKEMTWRELG